MREMLGLSVIVDILIKVPLINIIMWLINRFVRQSILARISSRVSIGDNGTSALMRGIEGNPLGFGIIVRNESPVDIGLTALVYRVRYEGVPIQGVLWQKGYKFATNGYDLNLNKEATIKASGGRFPFDLYYNRQNATTMNIEDGKRWIIEVEVKFNCFYGDFSKEFFGRYYNVQISDGT